MTNSYQTSEIYREVYTSQNKAGDMDAGIKLQIKSGRKAVLLRLIRMLFSFYPVLLPITLVCILFNAIISSVPSIFMQNVIAAVEQSWQTGDWAGVAGQILGFVSILAGFYALSLLAGLIYTQLMAIITQGSLAKMREKMFNSMQDLPIKYFDTHNHGDVMSYYTNDIDTLRQMISQSIPQLIISGVTVVTVLYHALLQRMAHPGRTLRGHL